MLVIVSWEQEQLKNRKCLHLTGFTWMKFLRRWDSMSLLTKLPENLTKQLIFKRITAAQSISFPWRDVANNTLRLVQAYSNSLGCPDKYIFFPLPTITASFIGTNGTLKINECWEEPSIMWFNVCARKGQKKTAGLNVNSQTCYGNPARTPTEI